MRKLAAALVCLAAAPRTTVSAQQQAATATIPVVNGTQTPQTLGPRLTPGFRSFEPHLVRRESTVTLVPSPASEHLVTTISTVGLIALGLVLILLLS